MAPLPSSPPLPPSVVGNDSHHAYNIAPSSLAAASEKPPAPPLKPPSPAHRSTTITPSSALSSIHARRRTTPASSSAMASRSAPAFVVLAVLALACGAASQAPAAGPAAPDCGAALTGLTGCLPYISPGSTEGKPPKECCAGVKAAVASPASVSCLCDAFRTNYGIPLNMTRAAGLPAACGANPAAFAKCNIKVPGAPTAAPTGAPTPASGSTPTTVSPSPAKSAATRAPVSVATLVLAALAAPLLSFYYL